jgi:Arc/MetJ-type ribon-helix-helix transcriptional regulator
MSLFPCKPETVRRAVALLTVTAVSLGAMSDTARAAAPEKKSRKPRVLVLGDSVFSMLLVADEALAELNDIIPVIYRGQPCQKLLTRGCIPEVELSALQQFKNARGEFTDAVVVATGYNENRPDALRESLREFKAEAKRQRVKLIWATYRIAGNVKGKATQFNSELRRAQKRDMSLAIFDWNRLSGNRPSWFSGDKVHLSRGGTVNLARQLGKFLKRALAPTTSTTAPG